jgi:hypothetical protein
MEEEGMNVRGVMVPIDGKAKTPTGSKYAGDMLVAVVVDGGCCCRENLWCVIVISQKFTVKSSREYSYAVERDLGKGEGMLTNFLRE